MLKLKTKFTIQYYELNIIHVILSFRFACNTKLSCGKNLNSSLFNLIKMPISSTTVIKKN